MTTYVNPSTRIGGTEQIVVDKGSGGAPFDDAPFDDKQYVRENGLWVPADFAPPHDHPYAASSHSHSYASTTHQHNVSSFINYSNGSTASGASINNGNTWTNKESAWAISVPASGHIVVFGSCWLQHNVSSGDPECRIDLSGVISGESIHSGRLGTGSQGGIEVIASTFCMTRASVTGAGTVYAQRQVRNHISSGTGHEWGNFDLVAFYTPSKTS